MSRRVSSTAPSERSPPWRWTIGRPRCTAARAAASCSPRSPRTATQVRPRRAIAGAMAVSAVPRDAAISAALSPDGVNGTSAAMGIPEARTCSIVDPNRASRCIPHTSSEARTSRGRWLASASAGGPEPKVGPGPGDHEQGDGLLPGPTVTRVRAAPRASARRARRRSPIASTSMVEGPAVRRAAGASSSRRPSARSPRRVT